MDTKWRCRGKTAKGGFPLSIEINFAIALLLGLSKKSRATFSTKQK